MKIYLGNTKKNAQEVTLIDALEHIFSQSEIKNIEVSKGVASDNSCSWVEIRKYIKTGAVDLSLIINEEGKKLQRVNIHQMKYKLDEENMELIA